MARQYPQEGKTEFTAKIPTPIYNEFVGFLPIHGANTWFILTSLNHFLKLLRESPELVKLARQAVEQTVKEL